MPKALEHIQKIHARILLAAGNLVSNLDEVTESRVTEKIIEKNRKSYASTEIHAAFMYLRQCNLLTSDLNGHSKEETPYYLTEQGRKMVVNIRGASKDSKHSLYQVHAVSNSPNVPIRITE